MATISPLDNRYRNILSDIATSDYRLQTQAQVEYEWACHLANKLNYKLTGGITFDFSPELIELIDKYEKKTQHDVKAIELAVAEMFFDERDHWLVHFGLTSEDINSFGNTSVMQYCTKIILEELAKTIHILEEKGAKFNFSVPARTHGQPAIPTTFKRRFDVYFSELRRLVANLEIPTFVKFGGSIGNFDEATMCLKLTHNLDFEDIVKSFYPFESKKFVREPHTFQTSLYTMHAEHFNKLSVICCFLNKIGFDLWDALSRGYFYLVTDKDRVGSSVMSQKVNPANTENAIGNFRIGSMWAQEMATTLPQFRLERDITDSTMLRNLPVMYGHIILGLRMFQRDLIALEATQDLDDETDVYENGQIYAARLQTYLRLNNIPNAYEIIRSLTQNKKLTKKELYDVMNLHFQEHLTSAKWGDLQTLMDMPFYVVTINTSNRHKQSEFSKFFAMFGYDCQFTNIDLPEPKSSQEDIVTYKASKVMPKDVTSGKFNGASVICEDSALYIENAEETGVNIRWIMGDINNYAGRKATFVVMLGYSDGIAVNIFRGEINGKICHSTQQSPFGFDANFIPDGATVPYSENKPFNLNPRFLAVKNYAEGQIYKRMNHMSEWNGEMQD